MHFSEERNPRIAAKEICEVSMEGGGHHVRCKAAAADPFAAIDLAVEKLEQQLHKLKTKQVLRTHQGPPPRAAPWTARRATDGVPPASSSGTRLILGPHAKRHGRLAHSGLRWRTSPAESPGSREGHERRHRTGAGRAASRRCHPGADL